MSGLTGTGRLLRLALRRDRIVLVIWVAALSALTAVTIVSVGGLYRSEAERVQAVAVFAASPAARVFDGPASGASLGAMSFVEAYGVLAILVAFMATTTVVRHTRQEEETGRAELVGAAVVGRHAALTAALCVAALANLLVASAVAGTLLGLGLPVAGSILAGAAVFGVACVFAGVAAVTAQLAHTQRSANGLAAGAIGVAFVLRATGDVLGEVAPSGLEVVSAWPAWLSPIGWGQQARAFHTDRWWVLGLFAILTTALVALAFQLTRHRDEGSGMLPERPGPARAAAWLPTPLGLAWRLQRGVLLGWAIGVGVMATAFGLVADELDEVIATSPELAEVLTAMGTGELSELYLSFVLAVIGLAVTGYTIQALLRMRGEETTGRLEPTLATPVSRTRWLLSHVVCAVGGTTLLLALAGLMSGVGAALAAGGGFPVGRYAGAGLVYLPAALILGGLVVAVYAVAPNAAAGVGWGALAASLAIGQVGALLDLPQAVLNLSPFTHVPAVPAAALSLAPLVWSGAVALALGTAGVLGFGRRDLVT